jgi:hypothetical protein
MTSNHFLYSFATPLKMDIRTIIKVNFQHKNEQDFSY